jgi:tRNA(Ile2) C34 agmatinyltransferase TiaS
MVNHPAVGAVYDKLAPICCNQKMEFVERFGRMLVWECGECGDQMNETLAEFHARTEQYKRYANPQNQGVR